MQAMGRFSMHSKYLDFSLYKKNQPSPRRKKKPDHQVEELFIGPPRF